MWQALTARPDEYLGRVHKDGRMDYHLAGRPDENIGHISEDASLAQAGAAFLLLVWPAFVEEESQASEETPQASDEALQASDEAEGIIGAG